MLPICAIPANVIETVLAFLVPFILPVTNNIQHAREAAWHMLGDYRVRTSEEFRLAGEIISFSLQTLTALANAAEPGLSFQKLCRYRAAAVSLKRAGTQAQRQYDALRKAPAAEASDTTLGELPPYAAPAALEPEVEAAAAPAAAPHVEPPAEPTAAPQGERAVQSAVVEATSEVAAQADPTPNLADRAHHLLEAARQAGNAGNHAHARQLAADARKASIAQQIRDGARRKQAEHAHIEAATQAYFATTAHSEGQPAPRHSNFGVAVPTVPQAPRHGRLLVWPTRVSPTVPIQKSVAAGASDGGRTSIGCITSRAGKLRGPGISNLSLRYPLRHRNIGPGLTRGPRSG